MRILLLAAATALLLATSCRGGEAIINDRESYVNEWKNFFDYLEKHVKTEIDDIKDNVRAVRESVSKAITKLLDYPNSSKAHPMDLPKVPLAIVHFVCKRLSIAGAQNIAKAFTQTHLTGHKYIIAYFIPYVRPYPEQYDRDLEVIYSLLPVVMHDSVIIVDASTIAESDPPEDVSDWDIDALAAQAFKQSLGLNSSTSVQPSFYWFIDTELAWVGSLPLTLAKWSYLRSDVHLALGCRDLREGSSSSSSNETSCAAAAGSVCRNASSREDVRIRCHPHLSRHAPALLSSIAEHSPSSWRSQEYSIGATIARRRGSKHSDLLDLDWNDLFQGCWGPKKHGFVIPVVSHVIEAYNSLVKAVLRHKWDDDMVYRAYDNRALRFVLRRLTKGVVGKCTSSQEFWRVEEAFRQGLYRARPGIIFKNITA